MGGRVVRGHLQACDARRTDEHQVRRWTNTQRCARPACGLPGDRGFITRQRLPPKPLLHPPDLTTSV